MEQLRVDALAPNEIAKRITEVAKKKSDLDLFRMFMLAILGGVFISLGAQFYTLVIFDSTLPVGLTKLIGGMVFSLGLILIVLAGAELFTGNSLMSIAFIQRMLSTKNLSRAWAIVYIGNFIGALAIVFLMYYSAQWTLSGDTLGAKALLIANGKVNLAWHVAFVRAILANALVCLAVWLCFGARSTIDKIFAIIFPITAFVASGFEHCIANMYFVPLGIWLKSQPAVIAAAQTISGGEVALQNLTWAGFLVRNLIPVTLGNILGGALLVGGIYWAVYIREFSWSSLFRVTRVGFQIASTTGERRRSPRYVASTVSELFSFLFRRKPKGRALPRDLTSMGIEEDEENKDQAGQ